MKKILTLLLSTCIISLNLTSVASASTKIAETLTVEKQQQKDNDAKVKEKAFNELFEKYNVEVLSEDEVKALKLNESNTPVLSSSISVDELEKIIIEQKQVQPIVEEKEVTIYINQDAKYLESVRRNLNLRTLKSRTETVYKTKTYVTNSKIFGGSPVRLSIAGSYQYTLTWVDPSSPVVSNKHFLSCNNGYVSMEAGTSIVPYTYKLDSVKTSKGEILSPTRLRHTYSYTVGCYYGIGYGPFTKWVNITSTPVNGIVNYTLK